jgi:hypothetical protein
MKYRIKQIVFNVDESRALRNAIVTFQRESGVDHQIALTGEQYNNFAKANINPVTAFELLEAEVEGVERWDVDVYAPAPNVIALWNAENAYISFMRSLGLPDKATTEEIEGLCMTLFTSGVQENINQALMISAKSLALINNVTQNGGKWADICWHEDI